MTVFEDSAQEPVSRRRFLALAGVLSATVAVPWGVWRGVVEQQSHAAWSERLAGLISSRDAAAVVGAAYLVASPAEQETAQLVRLLTSSLKVPPGAHVSDDALRGQLVAAVERDFASGSTTRVDGWVLSLTEARLSALVSLARR